MSDEWPFRGADAVQGSRLTARQLQQFYTAVYPGVYVPRWVELSAAERARAAWLWSRRQGTVAGLSASALLGAKWVEPSLPAQLVHTNRRPPAMLVVHSEVLPPGEVTRVGDIAVTTPARTAFDIGRRLPVEPAVQRIDALMNATGLTVTDVEAVVADHPGVRGLGALRTALRLVDGGAASPYESLTRLLLVRAGLPPPETQICVTDAHGFVVAYLDMGWREHRVGVEYDGAQHWTDPKQRRRDIERLADIEALGWIVVRVSSDMLRTSATVVARVRAALESRTTVRISTPRRRVR